MKKLFCGGATKTLLAFLLIISLTACTLLPSNSSSSQPASTASGRVEAGESSPFPAPVLEEYDSYMEFVDGEEYVFTYEANGKICTAPSSLLSSYSMTFASDEALAAIWPEKYVQPNFLEGGSAVWPPWEYNPVYVATSVDAGNSWSVVELPEAAGVFYSSVQVAFTSATNGWVMYGYNPIDGKTNFALFCTSDSGVSWQLVSTQEFDGQWHELVFADTQIGWMVARQAQGANLIFMTRDGGKTWSQSKLELPEEMLENQQGYYSLGRIHWNKNRWMTSIYVDRGVGKFSNSYDITPSKDGTWMWAEPGWQLPEGVGKIAFMDYLQNIRMPLNYDASVGLREEDGLAYTFWVFLRDYLVHVGRVQELDVGNYVLPTEEIEEMVAYMYDDMDFDATRLPKYDLALGGHSIGKEDRFYGSSDNVIFYSVVTNQEGDIEVLWERTVYIEWDGYPR